MKTVAVVIFNLGGPDGKESIKPFLFNFFMDKNIIRLPLPLRWMLAKMISIRRSKREAGDSYSLLGNKSPLLENTQAQATALENLLNKTSKDTQYKTYVCMRYWHPMSDEIAAQVKNDNPDKVVLLPFYPQFSTSTTRSSLQEWNRSAQKAGLKKETTSMACCYPLDEGFVKASAYNIRKKYEQALTETSGKNLPAPRVLFSAHGLPEDFITDGDPYQWQCEESAKAIVKELDMPELDWMICYQSRVGPKKWIGPSADEALEKAAADNVPVLMYPHAFVNEHVETLVEIEIEYRELSEELGVPYLLRVDTVSVHDEFIKGLANIVQSFEEKPGQIAAATGERICPSNFKRCCMNECSL